jgi:GNAT superfamily N-acetyltransferase
VSRRVVPLTGEVWEQVTAPCRACLFWASGERPQPDADAAAVEASLVRKQAWTTALVHRGRAPGRAVLVDGVTVGFVEFVPADRLAPRRAPVPVVDPEALVITTMWVEPGHRTRGLGRLLVQEALKEAIAGSHPAVEALADRRWRPDECVLPITWLLHEGFEVAREHPRYPLLRLEVSRTVRWAESLEHAVEEMRDLLPRRAPRPVVESASTTAGGRDG